MIFFNPSCLHKQQKKRQPIHEIFCVCVFRSLNKTSEPHFHISASQVMIKYSVSRVFFILYVLIFFLEKVYWKRDEPRELLRYNLRDPQYTDPLFSGNRLHIDFVWDWMMGKMKITIAEIWKQRERGALENRARILQIRPLGITWGEGVWLKEWGKNSNKTSDLFFFIKKEVKL